MFPDSDASHDKPPDKGPAKKMILVASDYVHHLRKDEKDSPPHLLASLKEDLRCATTMFVEELIAAGGMECLLEVLRVCQARQNDSKPARGRQALRKLSSDQYDCLLCLRHAMQNQKAVTLVAEYAHGLSSIASCFMSTFPKSRTLALQLLVRVLEVCGSRGHALILESLTAIRVVFGEAVRFKFLVGLLQGSPATAFQASALRFLNALLRTSPRPADKIRLQCELEEAGLDIDALETELRSRCIPCTDGVWTEIQTWRSTYLDVESVTGGKQNLENENQRLHEEVQLLRNALQKLEEDKINLMQIEMELKEKCEDLNEEVTTLKTEMKKPKPVSETDLQSCWLIEDDPFLSSADGVGQQLGTEEIFIDVPTLRPPVGFRSDSVQDEEHSPNPSTNSSNGSGIPHVLKKSFQTSSSTSTGFGSKASHSDKESADSALSESESDSGITWSYPDIPLPDRSRTRQKREAATTPFSRCQPSSAAGRRINPRSQSEDRRETRRKLLDGETKVVDSANFFLQRKQNFGRVSVSEWTTPPSRFPSRPSFQLPVAYRSHFLTRGHSNCDLYSGGELPPPIPPPDYSHGVSVASSGGTISALVHREITKAVKQISGWI